MFGIIIIDVDLHICNIEFVCICHISMMILVQKKKWRFGRCFQLIAMFICICIFVYPWKWISHGSSEERMAQKLNYYLFFFFFFHHKNDRNCCLVTIYANQNLIWMHLAFCRMSKIFLFPYSSEELRANNFIASSVKRIAWMAWLLFCHSNSYLSVSAFITWYRNRTK